VFGVWWSVSGGRRLVFGVWCSVSGVRRLVFGVWCSVFEFERVEGWITGCVVVLVRWVGRLVGWADYMLPRRYRLGVGGPLGGC